MRTIGHSGVGTLTAAKRWFRRHPIGIVLFFFLWISYLYFYQSTHQNEAARFDQMRAIVQHGTLAINQYWWNSADVIHYPKNGAEKIYPNKAPGMTLLSLGPFAVLSLGLSALRGLGMPGWMYWHLLVYLTTVFTVSLLSAGAAVAIYRVLRQIGGDAYLSALAIVAVWLGTLAFPYSTLFFSHQFVAAMLAIAFYLLFQIRRGEITSRRQGKAYLCSAGLLMSFSVAAEYPAALLVGLLSIYALWVIARGKSSRKDKATLVGIWMLGLAVGGSALVLYNCAAFGKPFYIPYASYSASGADFSATYGKGWLGLRWLGPRDFLHALACITIYPQIGMLYIGVHSWRVYACNPILWFALPGLIVMIRRPELRAEGFLILGMVVSYLLFVASYGESTYDWAGASYLGSRHLVPLLPFLTLPILFGGRMLRFLFYPVLGISIFYMLIATATEPRVSIPYENTARDLLIPEYLRARFAQNTDALFDGQRDLVQGSSAFNLGKLVRLPARYQLTPLLLWWLIAGGALLVMTSRRDGSGAPQEPTASPLGPLPRARLAGLLLFLVAVSLPPIIHHAAAASKNKQHGLLGKYYPNAEWTGTPTDVAVDPEINFDWTKSLPMPPPFSVEWTGSIVIEQEDNYGFAVVADDGAVIEIDGQTVVDDSKGPILASVTGEINLAPGLHSISVRYFNSLFGGLIKVSWARANGPEEIIPSEVLIPAAPEEPSQAKEK